MGANTSIVKSLSIKDLSVAKIIGAILLLLGLVMMVFAYFYAQGFTVGYYIIDDNFIIKIVFLVAMACIGWYMAYKSADLTGESKIRALMLLVIGAFLMISSFLTARIFLVAAYDTNILLNVLRIVFFLIGACIGITLMGKGLKEYTGKGRAKVKAPTSGVIKDGAMVIETVAADGEAR